MGALSVFCITLGLGQLAATFWQLRGASLVGAGPWAGYGFGVGVLGVGVWLLPPSWSVLIWTLPAGLLVSLALLWGGSYLCPPAGPQALFEPDHPAHGSCQHLDIIDGNQRIPAILIKPPANNKSHAAVCLVHGAGDHKTFFKSQLIAALLAKNLMVLTLDLPGHGDYRRQPLSYPEVLSTVPAALYFLRQQPGIEAVGIVGVSLGGAVAIRSLAAQPGGDLAQALVIAGTPTHLRPDRHMFSRELWRTIYGSPSLDLLQEMSIKQAWQMWRSGGYRSRHTTAELFDLLAPVENLRRLRLPIFLVYSRRDSIAPWSHAQVMQQAAPGADYLETKKASHVMLTLMPEITRAIADWLHRKLI